MGIFRFIAGADFGALLFYFAIAIVVTYLFSRGVNGGKKTGKLYFWIAFFILWFFQTFRSVNVGVDTADYVEYFENLGIYGWSFTDYYMNREILFNVHLYLVSRISHSYTVLFAANAIITNCALLFFVRHFFKKQDSFTMLPLFMLNYVYDMAAMRSSLAVAFVLIAFVFLDKRKYIYCIIFAIIAALFHNTTIVAFIIILYRFFLLWKKDRAKGSTIFISALFVATLIYLYVASLQSALTDTKYGGYVEELGSGWLGIWNLVAAFILSVILIVRNRRRHQLFNTSDIVNVVVVALSPVIVQLGAYRLAKYFLMFRVVTYKTYFTELENKQSGTDKSLIKIVEFIIMLFGFLFYMGRMSESGQLFYEFAPIF